MPPERSLVTCPVEHEPLGFVTNDHPTGILTKKVSAPPTVTKVAETVIGVAFVPDVPIADDDVAVALLIVAAFAGAENNPNVRPMLAKAAVIDIETLFTISP